MISFGDTSISMKPNSNKLTLNPKNGDPITLNDYNHMITANQERLDRILIPPRVSIMQLKLISFKLCPFVHRAATLLQEKGIEYDIDYIDLKNKPQWFLEISPLGKVPVLCVEGKPLFESLAILEYLDETNLPSIHPGDPFLKARNRAFLGIVDGLFMANYKLNTSKNPDEFEAAIQKLQEGFALLEQEVQGPFFNGEDAAFLDVAAAPVFFRLAILQETIKAKGQELFVNTPKLQAWAENLTSWPSVRKAVVEDFEELYWEYLKGHDSWLTK